MDHRRLNLPLPESVILRNFSLYDNASLIQTEFGDGVFCLAGANGLGKSTFLAAINFAIIGLVADPGRKFDSVDEYYRYSLPFSASFFRGRISDLDRESAEIEVRMRVGQAHYTLVRSMFDPAGLRSLLIHREGQGESRFDDPDISDLERHEAYARMICRDVGLRSFEQLAFLQLFVQTFDERRHLLFWDEKVSQAALFLAFGVELDQAQRAEKLRRTVERADSLARNLQWQATDVRKRMRDLEHAAGRADAPTDEDIERHRNLLDHRDELVAARDVLDQELKDTTLSLADKTARRQALRESYDTAFAKLATARIIPSAHPTVRAVLSNSACQICGTQGPMVRTEVARRLEASQCPMCGSPTNVPEDEPQSDALADLRGLDDELRRLDAEIEASQREIMRLEAQRAQASEQVEFAVRELAGFERENEAALAVQSRPAVQGILDQYREQIAELQRRKKQERSRRDEAAAELASLQAELAASYAVAEEDFVPDFQELAREFLGLDVEIDLQPSSSGIQLLLTVESKRRRAEGTLSESQRFFVDIALRMALAKQLVPDDYPASLYIDTPEGSLDIAYERRAGSMFGSFIDTGNRIVMTANINTSQLLQRLGEVCGRERMLVERMTEWTSLSDVQAAEEDAFEQAFMLIEQALDRGDVA